MRKRPFQFKISRKKSGESKVRLRIVAEISWDPLDPEQNERACSEVGELLEGRLSPEAIERVWAAIEAEERNAAQLAAVAVKKP
jgi:hypothetical protein